MITIKGNPISVNALYRGRRFLTQEGKAIKAQYGWSAKRQWKKKPLTGNVSVIINVYFNDKRRHDIDNILKGILDSLTGIVWEDDSHITSLHVHKHFDKICRMEIDAFMCGELSTCE